MNKDILRDGASSRDRLGPPAGVTTEEAIESRRAVPAVPGAEAVQRPLVGGIELLGAGARPATLLVISFIDTSSRRLGITRHARCIPGPLGAGTQDEAALPHVV